MGTTTEPESPDYAAMAAAGATKAEIHAALEAHCAELARYYASLPDGKAQRDADIAASLATLRSETAEIRRLAREQDGPPDEEDCTRRGSDVQSPGRPVRGV